MENRIIAIDDDLTFLKSIRRGLITSGFKSIMVQPDPCEAARLFRSDARFDVALIDISMPGMDGLELLDEIKHHSPETECIMITAVDEAAAAVSALKRGAYDYLVKPLEKEEIIISINRALDRKRLFNIATLGKGAESTGLKNPQAFKAFKTVSPGILRILKEAELHAASDVPVLVTGESGTGKELLARAIHAASPRAARVFTPVNMAALTGSLFDAEFFGHTKGAYTGATRERSGLLASSDGGTLFLDEIGNLPMELQGKLLRTLQDGEYLQIGTDVPRTVDVRFIAATNADLEKLVNRDLFRKDLYYRLKGAWLHLPPLRERPEDIPALVRHFIADGKASERGTGIEEDALDRLLTYHFPGNVRELEAIIGAASNLSGGKKISIPVLPADVRRARAPQKRRVPGQPVSGKTLAEIEKAHILKTYTGTGRNKSQTARILDIALNTLRKKLNRYGVD